MCSERGGWFLLRVHIRLRNIAFFLTITHPQPPIPQILQDRDDIISFARKLVFILACRERLNMKGKGSVLKWLANMAWPDPQIWVANKKGFGSTPNDRHTIFCAVTSGKWLPWQRELLLSNFKWHAHTLQMSTRHTRDSYLKGEELLTPCQTAVHLTLY